jgi:hypothetical protein
MSLRGKDFRCELDPEMHEKLRIMTAFKNGGTEIATEGARLLEKQIAAEWHEFTILRERLERSGILRSVAENGGRSAEHGGKGRK